MDVPPHPQWRSSSLPQPSFLFLPPPPRPARRRCSLSPRAAASAGEGSTALVWFKHDLRIHDHPGLVAACSSCRSLVPFYVFDYRILSRFSDSMLKHALLALKDLKKSLQAQGSDLVIGYGPAEDAILKLVNEMKATHVFAEHEVEYELCQMLDLVKESLANDQRGSPKFVLWRTPFFDFEDLEAFPISYQHFQKLKLPLTLLLSSPSLPASNLTLDRGSLPTYDDLKHYVSTNPLKLDESWVSNKAISVESILKSKTSNSIGTPSLNGGGDTVMESQRLQKSFFLSATGQEVVGGTDIVLDALDAYLRYLEGTSRDDWQELHEKVRYAESRKGTSFGAMFGSALKLGTVSRRKVHYDAIKYEKDRNAGFLNPFGYSAATVASAVEGVISMEWYWLLALKSQLWNEGKFSVRVWSWNGHLVQYTMIGDSGPAVLLVHGFGAFFEHYRDNLPSIASGGNRVWAVTLLGFGRSEKPSIVYNELMWAELLRDFIISVVGEPVHLVGNSIGGYIVSIVAGFWPSIVKSVILINSAGSVKPEYSSVQFFEAGEASIATWLGARLLLLYLRLSAKTILKNYYPTNSGRVDDWLANEVIRASFDPGALIVLENVFRFNLSIPLNYLFEAFPGKVLIIQGMRDPLTNSKLQVSTLKENCKGITIRELDAGHCPHDEKPDEVNLIICEWIIESERSSNLC